MGPTWGHLGPTGPRWAPCWPHEPCYQGILGVYFSFLCIKHTTGNIYTSKHDHWLKNHHRCTLCIRQIIRAEQMSYLSIDFVNACPFTFMCMCDTDFSLVIHVISPCQYVVIIPAVFQDQPNLKHTNSLSAQTYPWGTGWINSDRHLWCEECRYHSGWTPFYFMYDPKCSTAFPWCTINAPAAFAWCTINVPAAFARSTNRFVHKVEFSYIGWNGVHPLWI